MIDYIKNSFHRMDLKQIRQFLLYGTDGLEDEKQPDENQPYKDRLKIGSDPIYERLKTIYPNECDFDKAADDLYQALEAYESVYMEMGMKAGARLVYQLLFTDNPMGKTNVSE